MKYKSILSFLMGIGFGLSQSNYFPLEIGNYWTYERMYYGPEIYQNEVIDTTTIDGNTYYKVYSTLNNYTKYYRVDSLQKLFRYNFSTGSDELIADFQMEPGDSTLISVSEDSIETYMYLTDTNRTIITVTDTFYNCYSFYYDAQEIYDDEMSAFYAPNLGLVMSVSEGPVPVFHTLIGAHIGGIDVLETINQGFVPNSYDIMSIYPNPYNNESTIEINLSISQRIQIRMYDLRGIEVGTITNGYYERGKHQFQINSDNLPSGIYIVKAISKDYSENRKVILLK